MTKIDIISGFLGAGKTTLIKKLLKEALNGQKVVLIENEFGEIGVDGGFLKEAGIEIIASEYANTNLGALTGNSTSPGGKRLITTAMSTEDVVLKSNKHYDNDINKGFIVIKHNHGISTAEKVVYTVLVAALPAAALAIGIAVSVKRRYL